MEVITEAIAFAIICFILAPKGSLCHRLKKGAGGAILYIALFQSYHILHPLLPTELGYVLHSTIWGALFAYATPNLPLRTVRNGTNGSTDEGKKEQGDDRQNDEEKKEHRSPKVGVQEGTPPTSTLT
jgi:hypothetical protein